MMYMLLGNISINHKKKHQHCLNINNISIIMSGDWNNIINSDVFIAYKTNYSFNLLTAWLICTSISIK